MMTLRFFNKNEKFEGEVLVPTNFEEYLIKEANYILNNVGRFADFIKIEGCDYITAQKIIFLLREASFEEGGKLPQDIWGAVTGYTSPYSQKTIWSRNMEKDKTTKEWLIFNPYAIKGYSINYNIYDLI